MVQKREKDENFFYTERKSRGVMNGVKMNLPKQFIHQIYKFSFSVLIIMFTKNSKLAYSFIITTLLL